MSKPSIRIRIIKALSLYVRNLAAAPLNRAVKVRQQSEEEQDRIRRHEREDLQHIEEERIKAEKAAREKAEKISKAVVESSNDRVLNAKSRALSADQAAAAHREQLRNLSLELGTQPVA